MSCDFFRSCWFKGWVIEGSWWIWFYNYWSFGSWFGGVVYVCVMVYIFFRFGILWFFILSVDFFWGYWFKSCFIMSWYRVCIFFNMGFVSFMGYIFFFYVIEYLVGGFGKLGLVILCCDNFGECILMYGIFCYFFCMKSWILRVEIIFYFFLVRKGFVFGFLLGKVFSRCFDYFRSNIVFNWGFLVSWYVYKLFFFWFILVNVW